MRHLYLALVALVFLLQGTAAPALDSAWELQEVNDIGFGIHPKVNASYEDSANKVVIEGVALAGSDEILDPANAYTLFIQDDVNPRGGIQVWAGSWFYGSLWQVFRATDYIDVSAGDRVRVTGYVADAERGKTVINHRHSSSPELVFHVEVIGHTGLPDPELIPSVAHCNYFDMTRSGGGEYYQTRFVMLHGVEVTNGAWANNSLLTVADETGSVGVLLSGMGDFSEGPQPQGKLSFVAIFDQEDTTPPHTEGYRLWVKKSQDVALALAACRQVRSHDVGTRVALINKVVSRVYDGFFYIQDADRSSGIRVTSERCPLPGQLVSVLGDVLEENREKRIVPTHLSLSNEEPAKPVFVTGPALRGENELDVYGLLVRCVVKTGPLDNDGLYNCTDDSGEAVLVKPDGISLPEGKTVVLTAVPTLRDGDTVLLVNDEDDIQILQ
jgi:hypothetical protein